jgi:hypothetical protein
VTRLLAGSFAVALGAAGIAHASIILGIGTSQARLQVDAKGDAEVTFVANGQRVTVIVPPHGLPSHAGSLAGPDVSRPVAGPKLPFALTVRRTPEGRLWALQLMQAQPTGAPELHLARWTGAPTTLTLATNGTHVTGTASFQGRPVAGFTSTLGGRHPRIYVLMDCFSCGGKPGWTRMLSVPPRADGRFSVYIQPQWKGTRYRATVAGPNFGLTLAPDAQAVIPASS